MEPVSSCGRFMPPCQCKTLPEPARFNSLRLCFNIHLCQDCTEIKQPSSHLDAPSHPWNAEAADGKGQEPHLLSLVTTMTEHTTPRGSSCYVDAAESHKTLITSPLSAKRVFLNTTSSILAAWGRGIGWRTDWNCFGLLGYLLRKS